MSLIYKGYLKNNINNHTDVVVTRAYFTFNKNKIIIPTIDIVPVIDNVKTLYLDDYSRCIDNIEDIYVGKGDTLSVNVEDGYMEIRILSSSNLEDEEKIPLAPINCPCCNKELNWEYSCITLPICTNPQCKSMLYFNVNRFINKIELRDQSILKNVVNRCIWRDIVKDPIDIFFLTKEFMTDTGLITTKQASEIYTILQSKRLSLKLHELLGALFHDLLTSSDVSIICDQYTSLRVLVGDLIDYSDNMLDEQKEDLLPNYVFQVLCDFFLISNDKHHSMVDKMMILQLCF